MNDMKPTINRVVVDTNIWYTLGSEEGLPNSLYSLLTPIYNNLWELTHSGLLIRSPEKVKRAIQKMMICSEKSIFIEPLKYIIKNANNDYEIEVSKLTTDMLIISQQIANGAIIKDSMRDAYYHFIEKTKNDLEILTLKINNLGEICKKNIKSKSKHRNHNNKELIINLLNFMAIQATDGKYELSNLSLDDKYIT